MALSSPGNRTSTRRKPLWRSGFFADYDCGLSARRIAAALNAEGVTPPRGGNKDRGFWGPSTIQNNWKRGTEILDNELYVGMLDRNHQTCLKDLDTTKRQARLPDGAFTTTPVTRHDIAGRQVPTTWRVELPARGLDITVTAQSPDA